MRIELEKYDHRRTSFRYITSDQNPSDCATRGLTVTDIKNSSLWWHGPIWLLKEQAMWPSWKLPELTSENLNRLQLEDKESQIIINVSTDKRNGLKDDLEIFLFGMKKLTSSLRKLLRISVFVMRFIKVKVWNNIERNIKDCLLVTVFQCLSDAEPVSTKEIQLLGLLWIRFIQQHCYEEVFTALKENKKHSLIHQLGLKKDEYGILRCYGRYTNADTSIEAKNPKLLPRKNCFTDLVIMEVHGRLIHAGVSHTLSYLRQEFWLPKGRAEVRRVLLQCVICKRYNGPSFRLPSMPPWPRERVSRSEPFQYIGLDYLGPINIKESDSVVKMWICLFTCLAIRAVH